MSLPGVPTFGSKAGEPDTVPDVVTDVPFTGNSDRQVTVPGVIPCGVRGFGASCLMLMTTFPFASLLT